MITNSETGKEYAGIRSRHWDEVARRYQVRRNLGGGYHRRLK